MTAHEQVRHLLDFIDDNPSPWHAVANIVGVLSARGFVRLDEADEWLLKPGGRYYVVRDDASIVIVKNGLRPLLETGFKIIGAHTDSPGLRVKPNPVGKRDDMLRLNVEIYGSPILATFTDRDLSLAGRLCVKNPAGRLETRLIRFDKPLLRLPNLAIHLNRGVNEDGLKLQKQSELPLLFSANADAQLSGNAFGGWLGQQADIDPERVLTWELAVYDCQKGAFWGKDDEFYTNSQLDNLASCHAALQALLDEDVLNQDGTLVSAFFDHEEIGSESKHGAAGSFLPDVLTRVALANDIDSREYPRVMAKSFLISADMAHAYHPNFPGAYDADHKVYVNKGPVIKVNANQRYSSESFSEACFVEWCRQSGVPHQFYSHRCDLPCGSTIGPIASAKLGVRSVDVGNPMWAMHSLRESAGVFDHHHMIRVMRQFYLSAV